jgi:hypothetical protein
MVTRRAEEDVMSRRVVVASLIALGAVVHAADWELTRPGSAPIIRPAIHDTELQGQMIGCVTLSRREMRSFGYPGHAVFCEEATNGEVLGVVVNKKGKELCVIRGFYNLQASCYDLVICDDPTRLCKRQ